MMYHKVVTTKYYLLLALLLITLMGVIIGAQCVRLPIFVSGNATSSPHWVQPGPERVYDSAGIDIGFTYPPGFSVDEHAGSGGTILRIYHSEETQNVTKSLFIAFPVDEQFSTLKDTYVPPLFSSLHRGLAAPLSWDNGYVIPFYGSTTEIISGMAFLLTIGRERVVAWQFSGPDDVTFARRLRSLYSR
jgi:hypothetical protein